MQRHEAGTVRERCLSDAQVTHEVGRVLQVRQDAIQGWQMARLPASKYPPIHSHTKAVVKLLKLVTLSQAVQLVDVPSQETHLSEQVVQIKAPLS